MSPRNVIPAALAAVLAAAAANAATDPPVHTARIDAIVVDARGAAVGTLTPRDFELREDGKLLTLDEARFLKDDARVVGIYLDEYHITPGASADRAREALTQFVDQELGPRDRIVVMKPLDSLLTIRFASDLDEARRLIASLEGRAGDFAPRTDYERRYMAGASDRVETVRTQVVVSGLNALALHLGSPNGARKTLLVVSERLGGQLPRRRGQEQLATIEWIVRSAARGNVALYPIDPRPASNGDGNSDDVLGSLARNTGGRTVANAADLTAAIRSAAADADAYYMLTYRNAHAEDGAFHPVEVRVKRAGVQVRARPGFWAPSANDQLGAELLAMANRPPDVVPPQPARRSSPLIRPWFGLSLGTEGKMRVTFVWEPSAVVPGDRARTTAARVELTVLGEGGAVLFQGPVRPTGPGVAAQQASEPSRAVFDTAPGRLRLSMKIQDAEQRDVDADVRDLAVRDLRGRVVIGTPEFLRARNAREFRALASNPDAAPVSSREFSRTERLLIRFPAYAPDGQRPSVSARLLNRMGQPMRTLDVRPGAGGGHEIDLALAGLPNGEYQVEVAASTPAGQIKELLGFRVTS